MITLDTPAFAREVGVGVTIGYEDNLAYPFGVAFAGVDSEHLAVLPGCAPANPAARVTTFACSVTLPATDGAHTVCAVVPDAAVPDNPNSSDQRGTATQANLSERKCREVVLDRAAPSATVTVPADLRAGNAALFVAGASDATSGIASATWNWGDGTTSTGFDASHVYAAPGTYRLRFAVTDAAGHRTEVTKDLTVQGVSVHDRRARDRVHGRRPDRLGTGQRRAREGCRGAADRHGRAPAGTPLSARPAAGARPLVTPWRAGWPPRARRARHRPRVGRGRRSSEPRPVVPSLETGKPLTDMPSSGTWPPATPRRSASERRSTSSSRAASTFVPRFSPEVQTSTSRAPITSPVRCSVSGSAVRVMRASSPPLLELAAVRQVGLRIVADRAAAAPRRCRGSRCGSARAGSRGSWPSWTGRSRSWRGRE